MNSAECVGLKTTPRIMKDRNGEIIERSPEHEDTPKELREYVSEFGSAVGTKSDWEEFAQQNGFTGVELIERKG